MRAFIVFLSAILLIFEANALFLEQPLGARFDLVASDSDRHFQSREGWYSLRGEYEESALGVSRRGRLFRVRGREL